MRDPLLDGGIASLVAYRNAGEVGRKEACELGEADDIVADLVEWCRILLHETDVIIDWEEGQELSELLVLLSDQVPFPTFEEISDVNRRNALRTQFERFLENGGRHEPNVMAWLLGVALAKSLVEGLENSSELQKCPISGFQNLASSRDVSSIAFEETLQSLLRKNASAFAAILSGLERCIETLMLDPGMGTYSREREGFNQTIEAWRSKPTIEELWRTSGHWVPLFYRMLDLVPCIAPIDRAEVLKRLDRFDFPHPVRQVLEATSILHDREEIAALLKDAPSCSNDGQSWNQSQTALLVLDAAEAHCRELWRAASKVEDEREVGPGGMQQTEETLSSWLHHLAAIVMTRQDGRFLGSQWLLLKVADERTDRARQGRVGDRRTDQLEQDDLIERIAVGLSKGGLKGRDIEALVELPDSSSGRNASPVRTVRSDEESEAPRLAALSMSGLLDHMIDQTSSRDVGRLLERLDTLLGLRHPEFESECALTTDAHGLPANCCGHLFANALDPCERWQQSWNRLVEQRRRAQHWSETKDGDAVAPSLFLLAAGTAAIERLISFRERNVNDEKELWRAVFDGARDCWLTVLTTAYSGKIEAHVGRLFASHPRVFNASAVGNGTVGEADEPVVNESYSERLAEDLASLGGNDLVLVVGLLNAHQNGASLETMSEVLQWQEGRLDDVLKQFEKWQQVERSVRQRPALVGKLAELRAELAQFQNA